jgi:hypothetical protein
MQKDGIAVEVFAIIVGVPSTKDMVVPMVVSAFRAPAAEEGSLFRGHRTRSGRSIGL